MDRSMWKQLRTERGKNTVDDISVFKGVTCEQLWGGKPKFPSLAYQQFNNQSPSRSLDQLKDRKQNRDNVTSELEKIMESAGNN